MSSRFRIQVLGQAITTPVVTPVNATYSLMDTVTGTLSGSPAIVLAQGYLVASATAKTAASRSLSMRYPITLNEAGAVRDLGRLTVLAQGVGGASACRAVLSWRELR